MADAKAGFRAEHYLDQVHKALISADFAALGPLTAHLQAELDNPSEKMTEARLRIIRRKAERNAACLLAAQRGIRSARRRLTEIRSTAKGLVTYTKDGHRAEVSENRNLAQRL